MRIKYHITALLASVLLTACSTSVPTDYSECKQNVNIYPDYTGLEIPYNIAPLNFIVNNEGDAFIVKITCGDKSIIEKANSNKEIIIDADDWHQLLADAKGKSLQYDLYAKQNGKWQHFNSFSNKVSTDSIDGYLTYRLIEPSYKSSGEMGIYQFDLCEGEEVSVFTTHHDHIDPNKRTQKCMNCHSSQRNHPENKLFYYRSTQGGLFLTYNGELKKINTKCGDMFASTVYPAWHPTLPFIAFSSNSTKQMFHSENIEKIDPYDQYSDLVLYDIQKNEITAIRKTYNKQESFPCWSPDGQYLYFNSSDSLYSDAKGPRHMLYNLYRMKFNASDKSWGEPELIYEPAQFHMSATAPRVSPDGKYLLFTQANYGTSTQTNKTADLYLMDLKTKAVRNLKEINCPTEADSYHDWSRNSKWIVFASRREDGNFARPFFAHVNADGTMSKPFIIPCKDPKHNSELIKNYNVTEFSATPVEKTVSDIQSVIEQPEIKATYGSPIDTNAVNAYSGASQVK